MSPSPANAADADSLRPKSAAHAATHIDEWLLREVVTDAVGAGEPAIAPYCVQHWACAVSAVRSSPYNA